MAHGHGGKRPGAGKKRQPRPEVEQAEEQHGKSLALEILESLGKDNGHPKFKAGTDGKPDEGCWCEVCLWREDCKQRTSEGTYARKFLWEQARGKAKQTIVHGNEGDKPLVVQIVSSIPAPKTSKAK